MVEGRRPAKGNTDRPTRTGHSAGSGVSIGLDRVRRAVARGHEAADLASPVACRPTRRVLPEVGAQCGSSARWDLCGGLVSMNAGRRGCDGKEDLADCGAGREMEVGPSGAVVRTVAPNHHEGRWLVTVVLSVVGKGAAVTASGVEREDER